MTAVPITYQPNESGTLKEYLQRYSIDDIINILEHPGKLNEFCTILLKTSWSGNKLSLETDAAYQKLWRILNEQNENYTTLLNHIELWESSRYEVLEKLSEYGSQLRNVSKKCTVVRMIGYSTEILSKIIELQFTGFLVDISIFMAGNIRTIGSVLSVCEVKKFQLTFEKLKLFLERDKELFAPIHEESEKVKAELLNVFSFDFASKITKELKDIVARNKVFDPISLFSSLLKEVIEKNKGNTMNKENEWNEENFEDDNRLVIQKLVEIISHPSSKRICEWIYVHCTHHDRLHVLSMMIHCNISPLRYLAYELVPPLVPSKQKLYSMSVIGHLFLNGCFLLCDIAQYFDLLGMYGMQNLENHLKWELEAVNRIKRTLREK